MRQSHRGLRLLGVMSTWRPSRRDSEHLNGSPLKAPGRKGQVTCEHLEPDHSRPVSSILEDTGARETSHVEGQGENDISSLLFWGEKKEKKKKKKEKHTIAPAKQETVWVSIAVDRKVVHRTTSRKIQRGCRSQAFRVSVTSSEANSVGLKPCLTWRRRDSTTGQDAPSGRCTLPALLMGAGGGNHSCPPWSWEELCQQDWVLAPHGTSYN